MNLFARTRPRARVCHFLLGEASGSSAAEKEKKSPHNFYHNIIFVLPFNCVALSDDTFTVCLHTEWRESSAHMGYPGWLLGLPFFMAASFSV